MPEQERREPSDWGAWMAAAQDGDAAAYERLLRELLPALRGFVSSRLGDPSSVEDVAQNVLLSVHRARHTYRPERRFEPWFWAIARNAIIDAQRARTTRRRREEPDVDGVSPVNRAQPMRLAAKEYMEEYINPKAALEEEAESLEEERKLEERFPVQPEKDVLSFLIEHAPLANWQRNVLGIIREESYYFAPQGRTKIMNEGWASYLTKLPRSPS